MKVLLHDGELILEMDCPHMVLPDLKIELYNYLTRKGVVYRLSDRKADGMVVYYRENMNKEGNGPEEIHS